MREEVLARLGDLAPHCDARARHRPLAGRGRPGGPVRAPRARRLRAHDPDGDPGPGHDPVRDGRQDHVLSWACRRTASPRCGWSPASRSSPATTASTSGSGSTRCGSGCRSSTTWSRPTAAERVARLGASAVVGGATLAAGADRQLLLARLAAEQAADAPPALRVVLRRSWCWRTSSISAHEPSLWRWSMRYCSSMKRFWSIDTVVSSCPRPAP